MDPLARRWRNLSRDEFPPPWNRFRVKTSTFPDPHIWIAPRPHPACSPSPAPALGASVPRQTVLLKVRSKVRHARPRDREQHKTGPALSRPARLYWGGKGGGGDGAAEETSGESLEDGGQREYWKDGGQREYQREYWKMGGKQKISLPAARRIPQLLWRDRCT